MGCRADVSAVCWKSRGRQPAPSARQQQQFAAVELNLMQQTSIWVVDVEVAAGISRAGSHWSIPTVTLL